MMAVLDSRSSHWVMSYEGCHAAPTPSRFRLSAAVTAMRLSQVHFINGRGWLQ